MKKISVGSIALGLWGLLALAGASAPALTEDFSTDSGLWTYTGSAYRDAAGGYVVLTSPATYVWGQVWLNEPRKAPFLVTFRYRAGGGLGGLAGGDGLVFMFHKSMDYSPTFPDYGGSLGFSKSPHTSLTPVPGYGVELDSAYNLPIYNDPSWNHIALIKDHAGNHLASVNDSRVADDLWHEVEIHVNDASVAVVVDGDVVLVWNGTIDHQNGGLGFSAATGGYSNWHLIDDFTITDPAGMHLVDNGDPGTSFTGYWQASGAPDPYGESSLFARNGATYAYTLKSLSKGRYDVLAWWTSYPSRATSVPFVVEHAEGDSMVFVDQLHGGGRWNLIGNFLFDGAATVRILALGAATTCADAIQLAPTELEPPTAVPEIVLDGGDPGTTALGEWAVSGAPNPYGGRSLYSKSTGATYSFSTPIAAAGLYEVYAWWTEWPSRSSEVPIEVRHADGTSLVKVNQLTGGGRWNHIGTYTFSTFAVVKITSVGTASTCADAIRFVGTGVPPPPPPTGYVVVENGAPGTSSTGTWLVSGAPEPSGADSLYAKSAGATYTFGAAASGAFNVYAWWTEWPSRSESVPIVIRHAGGTTTVRVNQRLNGGQWNLLGKFSFAGTVEVTVVSDGGDLSTCADAVRLQP